MTARRRVSRVCVVVLMLSWLGNSAVARQHIVPEGPLTPEQQIKKFHLPPGFEIELVVSEPQIGNPLNFSFDAKGRLWVTSTVEYPFPPKGPGRDTLNVLEDCDGDGRYEKVTTLVDGLSMPTGATPVPGGAIVFSVPSIFRCYDTDGDGKIDRRNALYGEFGNIDAHGMNNGFTRWLDGWIYACHGYRNTSQVSGSDGVSINMNSGNGYRFRMDGSHIEYVWHGQVNPFGIAFDSLGNLFTADCHSKPAYCLLRGAYYPSFGKPHDGLGFGPQLINHSHGSTSISGIAYYAADQFPEEYRDAVFMGNSVTGRVNWDKVVENGSSLRGIEQPDFVTCDDRWFRPVELKLGPDGALYIADFYDCIIGYYEVPLTHPRRDRTRGRVWRVVWKGTEDNPGRLRKIDDLTQLDLAQLWGKLADANLSVRTLATHEICDRFGTQAVGPVQEWISGPCDPRQRAHGLWMLERLGGLDDDLAGRLAVDEDRLVRVHLVKALAERPDWNALSLPAAEIVRQRLFDSDGMVRRAAADALGRHPQSANFLPLMRLWEETPREDTYLIHTVRMTLRDHLKQPEVFAKYARLDDVRQTRRLLDVALGVRDARSATFVLSALRAETYDAARLGELVHYATRYAPASQVDAAAGYALGWQQAVLGGQLEVFRSFGLGVRERGSRLPPVFIPWAERLAAELIAGSDAPRALEGVQLAAALRLRALYDPLRALAASADQSQELRTAALDACVAIGDQELPAWLDGILADPVMAYEVRAKAAEALERLNTDAARELLYTRLVTAHYRLAVRIGGALASRLPGAETLLLAIEQGKASPRLLQELRIHRRLEAIAVPDLKARLAKLTADLPPQDELTTRLVQQRKAAYLAGEPDADLGKKVFETNCAICHQIDGEGKKFGPDLDGIGLRGLDRVLEDVLDPSRNVDPLFRTTVVITDDGLTHSGLALRDEGEVLILVDAEGKELRIGHDEIDERFISPLSPMPTVAIDTVSEANFLHVIRYLVDETTDRLTAQ